MTTIFHNPRCSKSRTTLALLEEHQIKPTIIKYLETPPSYQELSTLLEQLGMRPRQLLRKGEDAYKALGLGDETLSDKVLVQSMVDNPKLIERPIVVHNNQAKIGRPPESVLELFK